MLSGDFRLSPPAIEGVIAEKAPDGGTLIRASVARDRRLERTFTLGGRQAIVTFHDDGAGGNHRAGDGFYAASLPVPFAELRDGQTRLVELLRKRGIGEVPIFQGRAEVGPGRGPKGPGAFRARSWKVRRIDLRVIRLPSRLAFPTSLNGLWSADEDRKPLSQTAIAAPSPSSARAAGDRHQVGG